MAGKIDFRYPVPVDVETAYAALSSDQWAPAKAEQLGDDSKTLSREVRDGGAVTLVVSRKLPDGVPGFLTKFLPADGRVKQTDTWGPLVDGVRSGTWVAETPGSPADVRGTMRLEPSGDGCTYVIQGTAKVSIPLIGGKAENLVIQMTQKLTGKEVEVLRSLVS